MIRGSGPALILAPMDGITDAPMRAYLGLSGAFSFAVTEFIRVSQVPLPPKVFRRDVPELANGGRTVSGMLVQVQILGGDPERMAITAANAVKAGASSIDINFGCPAPTVNRNDGGASILKFPCRIREIVAAVRGAVPIHVSVSAKIRLGWDSIDDVDENAAMAAEGGAEWLTIHARTRSQGYQPPVYYEPIARVRSALRIPIVANGDIWTFEDYLRCRDVTGCERFMIGRGALANPSAPLQIASDMGLLSSGELEGVEWGTAFREFIRVSESFSLTTPSKTLLRLKQWANLACRYGSLGSFDELKRATSIEGFLQLVDKIRP